jgi:molybdopterin-dependent oxidoreductase alpha subunit
MDNSPPSSSKKNPRSVQAQPPEDLSGGSFREPRGAAGGVSAIVSTVAHTQEMGFLRGIKTLLQTNQENGFDCPGCAWPDPDSNRDFVEFCENGAKAVATEATLSRIGLRFFEQYSVEELGHRSDHWLNKQGRLTHPMWLPPEGKHYLKISWEDAFTKISQKLRSLRFPNEAVFYTSGRTSNEAAFLFQLFVRQFGTNNLPDCSNLCHESSGVALTETLGIGKGTVRLEDFERTQVIFVIGQNPGTNHPRMLTSLQKAVRNGAQIVSINPLDEMALKRFKHPREIQSVLGSGTQLRDLHLPVKINGDVAVLKGILKHILEAEERSPGKVLDHTFIKNHSLGFEAFKAALEKVSWDAILEESGVEESLIRKAGELAAHCDSMICCWAMGLTQHENAVANIQETVNLLLLRGQIGKPGAGVCPVRGHSNVQGDRTMGITSSPSESFLSKLEQEFNFQAPRKAGYSSVEAIQAMETNKVRVFLALGGNFLSASPDTERTSLALSNCDLTVQISTKLNRSHLITGNEALILPCLGRTERDIQANGAEFVTVENSMGIVHRSQGQLEPASNDLLSEPAIVARLADKTLLGSDLNWGRWIEDYDQIRERISRVIPGFEDFNRKVRQGPGFYLPNPPRDELRFPTAEGKAKFSVHPLHGQKLKKHQFLMMTIRSHDQYNTTIYGLDDRYRGVKNERRVVFMNPLDLKQEGLKKGDLVDIISEYAGKNRIAKGFISIPYEIPQGCVATYFPETNVLVPLEKVAKGSQTPACKSVVVRILMR